MSKKQHALPELEPALAEITLVIEKMEQGDLTLDQSLNHFERGVTLIKHCQKILEKAEQKVQILLENNKGSTLAAYDQDEEEDDENRDDE